MLPRGPSRRRAGADGGGAGPPQRRRRADGRGAHRARRPGRGGRPGRSAGGARGRRRGRDAAAGGRPDRRGRGDAGADRAPLAAGRPRHLRAVAPRGATSTTSRVPRAYLQPPSRSWHSPRPTPIPPVWPTRSATRDPRRRYSPTGITRIVALGRELTALRAHLTHPLPDLVAEVRRVLGVDIESRAVRPVSAGLDAAPSTSTHSPMWSPISPPGPARQSRDCWRILDAAEQVENGLAPAVVAVAHDRVQILTVHAAKGLEWQVVAVPHLSGRVFPSTASARTWLTDAGDLPPLLRGDRATVSEHGVPVLDTSDVNDRKRLSDKISDHKRRLEQRRIDEERRLLYVAITRAEDTLLLSGHHWGAAEAKPRGPSEFLCELKDIIEQSDNTAAGDPCGVVEQWAPAPADGEPNPLRDKAIEAVWPTDPLARAAPTSTRAPRWWRRPCRVTSRATSPTPTDGRTTSTRCWPNASPPPNCPPPPLPAQLSVSTLVELGRDPDAVAQRLRRRLPAPPGSTCAARHRIPRLGAAVLPRRAAVRPRRPSWRGRSATRRRRTAGRAAGRVRGIAVGRAHTHRC